MEQAMPGEALPGSSLFSLTASKGSNLGTICLWSWSQTWLGRGSRSTVPVVVLARLQWSPTELAYFSLSTCPGKPTYTPHPASHLLELHPTSMQPLAPQMRGLCSAGMRKAACGSTTSGRC